MFPIYHGQEFLAGQLMALVGTFEHGIGQVALSLVQTQDFFLDGMLGLKQLLQQVMPWVLK